MFQDANVDNRQRFYVRGRVIVFTTSKIVEYLSKDLTRSLPLYSNDTGFDTNQLGQSFMVEVDGFLTFDEDTYVKISDELAPFSQFYYDPTAVALVRPADPFRSLITSGPGVGYASGAPYLEVYFSVAGGGGGSFQYKFVDMSLNDQHKLEQLFAIGSQWLGPNGYPGLIPMPNNG